MPPKAAAIGVFDGLHLGHVELLRFLADEAGRSGLEPIALTFEPPPSLYFNPHFHFLLSTSQEKQELISSLGVADVVFLDFNKVAKVSPQAFITNQIARREIKLVVVGKGFHFGKDRQGGVKTLVEMGKALGFRVVILEKLKIEDEPVSATRIRELLLLGHIRRANALLGYPYRISGKISKGLGRAGALLDTPTVNLVPDDEHKLIPPDGVYAVGYGPEIEHGVCYIGGSPTFGDSTHKIEVHLLAHPPAKDVSPMLHFVQRLRPDWRFASIRKLKEQVKKDVEEAGRVLSES